MNFHKQINLRVRTKIAVKLNQNVEIIHGAAIIMDLK